jgi:hypothetical protein
MNAFRLASRLAPRALGRAPVMRAAAPRISEYLYFVSKEEQ